MARVTRGERRLDRELARATTPRAATIIIAVFTTLITVGAGVLMTLVDRSEFPTVGGGLWWAVQTVTTVGYGDHVPETAAGQIVAAFVMLLGIGFATVVIAAITGVFVNRSQLPHQERVGRDAVATAEQLQKMDARLQRIEAALARDQ